MREHIRCLNNLHELLPIKIFKINAIVNPNLNLLEDEDMIMVKMLCCYPRQIVMASCNKEPH